MTAHLPDLKIISALRAIVSGRLTSRHVSRSTGMSVEQAWRAMRRLEAHGRVERSGRLRIERGQPLVVWRVSPPARVRAIREAGT